MKTIQQILEEKRARAAMQKNEALGQIHTQVNTTNLESACPSKSRGEECIQASDHKTEKNNAEGSQYLETGNMTLTEIYEQLTKHGELIFTIPAEEMQSFRTGLASVKFKANKKLKEKGQAVDNNTLDFKTAPAKDENGNNLDGIVDIHVALGKKNAITILKIKIPDSEI